MLVCAFDAFFVRKWWGIFAFLLCTLGTAFFFLEVASAQEFSEPEEIQFMGDPMNPSISLDISTSVPEEVYSPQNGLILNDEVLEPVDPALLNLFTEQSTFIGVGRPLRPPSRLARTLQPLMEAYQFFATYVSLFDDERERNYLNRRDFRRQFNRRLADHLPYLQLTGEIFRTTMVSGAVQQRSEGAGGGLKLQFPFRENGGHFGVFAMPAYLEFRRIQSFSNFVQNQRHTFFRSNYGVELRGNMTRRVRAGSNFFVQPQFIDFSRYRIYAEAWMQFDLIRAPNGVGRRVRLRQVTFIPKVVWWRTTDPIAFIGPVVSQYTPLDAPFLRRNLYGIFNFQFRFGNW